MKSKHYNFFSTKHKFSRSLAAYFTNFVFVLFSSIASFQVQAQTPAPNLPLPPCVTTADGKLKGACAMQQNDDPGFSLEVVGRLNGEGSSINMTGYSALPVCSSRTGVSGTEYNWSPSPCYSRVGFSVGITATKLCSYIDLRDNEFKTGSCFDLLFKSRSRSPTFVSLKCVHGGNFGFDEFGRPIDRDNDGARGDPWSAVGPAALADCTVTFEGSRPDGLYGPTWILASVSLTEQKSPDVNSVGQQGANAYIPIDGDLRPIEGVDVAVKGAATISEANWDEGKLFATYTASVTNIGTDDAENVRLIASFPTDLTMVESVSDTANCVLPGISSVPPSANARKRSGGNLICTWSKLAADAVESVDIRVRITNATDLDALQSGITLKKFDQATGTIPQGALLRVTADDDSDSANNEELVKIDIPFRPGTYEETEAAMLALAPFFDYYTGNLFEQCNVYMNDIFSRLETIRLSNPDVFSKLSYGNITSGQYAISGTFGLIEGGHVGVVVYPKGTNYRKTGIIIHGTPTQSPLNFNSKLGPDNASDAGFIASSTSLSGFYYRTKTEGFPGFPQFESPEGFEGEYSNNGVEFTYGAAAPMPAQPDPNSVQCALPPNAVTIKTESPVDLLITNPDGKVVQTLGGEIVQQNLGMGIHSMGFKHDDGSYGWVIVLPKNNYDVKLTGNAVGPYTMTMTTYNDQGEPQDEVIQGVAEVGLTENFELVGATEQDSSGSNKGSSGGSGSFNLPTIIALSILGLCLSRRRKQN